ncbi:hypothetical protein K491DRAFT_684851 [Lophiostoma macrostomum CBS 122681]|uniref:Uncharacterized protein n=1 Tax=Lophiostoma macrostomum CBS 122681 TaxID=1314788 RepID=A0A6A6SLB7_9PLEO|nr:hypothetical protein K491DRAFT_684851 [Lophiostoma macrostomum CBS 122681]
MPTLTFTVLLATKERQHRLVQINEPFILKDRLRAFIGDSAGQPGYTHISYDHKTGWTHGWCTSMEMASTTAIDRIVANLQAKHPDLLVHVLVSGGDYPLYTCNCNLLHNKPEGQHLEEALPPNVQRYITRESNKLPTPPEPEPGAQITYAGEYMVPQNAHPSGSPYPPGIAPPPPLGYHSYNQGYNPGHNPGYWLAYPSAQASWTGGPVPYSTIGNPGYVLNQANLPVNTRDGLVVSTAGQRTVIVRGFKYEATVDDLSKWLLQLRAPTEEKITPTGQRGAYSVQYELPEKAVEAVGKNTWQVISR